MLDFVKKNKNVAIAIGVIAVGFWGYKFYQKKKNLQNSSNLAIQQATI